VGGDSAALARELRDALGERLGGVVAESAERAEQLAERDAAAVERLGESIDAVSPVLVPRLDSSLSELERLGAVTRELFADSWAVERRA
jgi:hypothetical protein